MVKIIEESMGSSSVNANAGQNRLDSTNEFDEEDLSCISDTELVDEEEEILAQDREYSQFDEIIGCIEDIVIEQQFQDLQESFLEKHYHHFEIGTEENKLIYMEIFQDYTKAVEEFIEKELEQRIENFNMKDFIKGKQKFKQKASFFKGCP